MGGQTVRVVVVVRGGGGSGGGGDALSRSFGRDS